MERLNDAKTPALPTTNKFPPGVLLILLALSLPLINPWVRGDGVGYYAFARAPLIQHNLDFTADYQHANGSFREARLDADGTPKQAFRTATGHLDNHFTIGPAMLWAPFLICAHLGVLLAGVLGAQTAANGFSLPYLLAMAIGTLLYGFLGLLLSYRVACRFVGKRWALLATITVWWASSLPVYMYFNPSWSHAHSAFAVALFFWYWLRTRESRSTSQWIALALIAGLALNVYYPNVLVLLVLVPEALSTYRKAWRDSDIECAKRLLFQQAAFCLTTLFALLPTFAAKQAIYGGVFETGYIPITAWAWGSPWFFSLLFSSNHGLFSWTPILLLATAGVLIFVRKFPAIGIPVLSCVLAFYYFMSAYPDWAGISSYGNRFFVSLTVFFILGLAIVLESIANYFKTRIAATIVLTAAMSFFVLWNLGLMFQWGSHLIPARGPVSWRLVAYNQVHRVPSRLAAEFHDYLFRRQETLREIEQRDMEQLRKTQE